MLGKVIIINGAAESGKDKFIEFVRENEGYNFNTSNLSTIDPSKEALKHLGWDGKTKDKNTRQAMVDIKRISMKYFNGPFNYIEEQVRQHSNMLKDDSFVFFVHCREPEEIQKFADHYGKDCLTLLVRSPRGKAFENGSDDVVENYDYDVIIENDGTLDDLKNKAIKFVNDHLIRS